MISCNLVGRMGNQMFQLAAAYAHALRHGFEFRCPAKSHNEQLWPSRFRFGRLCHPGTVLSTYTEPTHAYNPIPSIDNLRLNGYFQSEKYFKDYRKEVIEAFGFDNLASIDEVAVHVRRGDYVGFADHHPPVDNFYLELAMSYFPNKDFMVFSDDLPWCRLNVRHPRARFVDTGDDIKDFKLMASCRHQIIANSTYSWWAAWINPNPDKIVIAPKNWFGPKNAHLDTKDILPENWLQI